MTEDIPARPPDQPSVTVVIPALNAALTLAAQLDALAVQTYRGGDWEIVVADNGSVDGTADLVRSCGRYLPRLTLVDASDRPGSAHARNVGATAGSGSLLLFLDADDVVAPGYVEAMVAALGIHAFVAARVDHLSLGEGATTRDQWQVDGLMTEPYLPCAAGGTLGVRREAFEAVNGFDTMFDYGQDDDFCWRIQLAGYPLVFVPEALVAYRSRATLREHYRQERHWGVYESLAYQRYRVHGMRRQRSEATRGWLRIGKRMVLARTRDEWVFVLGLLGKRIGRLQGSLRYRVFYP